MFEEQQIDWSLGISKCVIGELEIKLVWRQNIEGFEGELRYFDLIFYVEVVFKGFLVQKWYDLSFVLEKLIWLYVFDQLEKRLERDGLIRRFKKILGER